MNNRAYLLEGQIRPPGFGQKSKKADSKPQENLSIPEKCIYETDKIFHRPSSAKDQRGVRRHVWARRSRGSVVYRG